MITAKKRSQSKFFGAGMPCICTNYMYVHYVTHNLRSLPHTCSNYWNCNSVNRTRDWPKKWSPSI